MQGIVGKIHVELWPDRVVCGRGFADRIIHADADARGAADQTTKRRKKPKRIETEVNERWNAPKRAEPTTAIIPVGSGMSICVYTWLLRFSMAHRWVIIDAGACLSFLASFRCSCSSARTFCRSTTSRSSRSRSARPRAQASVRRRRLLSGSPPRSERCPASRTRSSTVGGGQQQVVNAGTIYVKLTDIGERSKSQQTADDGRSRNCCWTNYPPELSHGVQPVAAFSGGGFRNANVQFMVSGPDLKKLEEYSAEDP